MARTDERTRGAQATATPHNAGTSSLHVSLRETLSKILAIALLLLRLRSCLAQKSIAIPQARRLCGIALSIRVYCAMKGFAENTYFYWQRRLRDALCKELVERSHTTETGIVPTGWMQVSPAENIYAEAPVTIEINVCRVAVTAETDPKLSWRQDDFGCGA